MIKRYSNDLHAAVTATVVTAPLGMALKTHDLILCLQSARTALVVGNGGSQAVASHVAIDLCKTAGIPTLSLNDPATMTCLANDYGYENVYSKQIEWHGKQGQVLIVISSSGESENILGAAKTGRDLGMCVVTFSGFEPTNPLRKLGHINFYTPSDRYGIVELAHHVILHAVTDALMEERLSPKFSTDDWRGATKKYSVKTDTIINEAIAGEDIKSGEAVELRGSLCFRWHFGRPVSGVSVDDYDKNRMMRYVTDHDAIVLAINEQRDDWTLA